MLPKNEPMPRIFDMHVHTTKGSGDSNLSPEDMVLEAERLGFLGLCITEHSGPWEEEEFKGFAASHNLVLVRAMEVDTDMGHILAFGLNGCLPGIATARQLRSAADRAGGFIVIAHPFRGLYSPIPSRQPLLYKDRLPAPESTEEAAKHAVFGLVDAVEVANGGTSDEENRFAMDVASLLGLSVTGGSDAHSRQALGRYVTAFDGEIGSQEQLLTALHTDHFYPARLVPNNGDPHGSSIPAFEPLMADEGQ